MKYIQAAPVRYYRKLFALPYMFLWRVESLFILYGRPLESSRFCKNWTVQTVYYNYSSFRLTTLVMQRKNRRFCAMRYQIFIIICFDTIEQHSTPTETPPQKFHAFFITFLFTFVSAETRLTDISWWLGYTVVIQLLAQVYISMQYILLPLTCFATFGPSLQFKYGWRIFCCLPVRFVVHVVSQLCTSVVIDFLVMPVVWKQAIPDLNYCFLRWMKNEHVAFTSLIYVVYTTSTCNKQSPQISWLTSMGTTMVSFTWL